MQKFGKNVILRKKTVCFIAGLPLIASDWAHSRQFLREGETALFILQALAHGMLECIEGQVDILSMRTACQAEAAKYRVGHVITPSLLKEIDYSVFRGDAGLDECLDAHPGGKQTLETEPLT